MNRYITAIDLPASPGQAYPCKIGIPFQQGALHDASSIRLRFEGKPLGPVRARALKYWHDRSIKWCLLEWIFPSGQAKDQRIEVWTTDQPSAVHTAAIEKRSKLELVAEEKGGAKFSNLGSSIQLRLRALDASGKKYEGSFVQTRKTDFTPVREQFNSSIDLKAADGMRFPLDIEAEVNLYGECNSATVRITARNPHPSAHPNGNWDLGNEGSLFLRDYRVDLSWDSVAQETELFASTGEGATLRKARESISIFQASSGGENWKSRVHLDKDNAIPLSFRGYELAADGQTETDLRATPEITINCGERCYSFAVADFWETFPKRISATVNSCSISFLPKESGYLHEIQGGEQKTDEFAIYLGPKCSETPLAWYLAKPTPVVSPDYYASTGVIPYLTPRLGDPNQPHAELVDLAIVGDDTFIGKREKIDEYGWRNFGDIYGDHEAVFHQGDTPLISHFNNQYDATGGFALQFFRTGMPIWYRMMIESANHSWDIDTYHTSGDKNLYNGGLFWHTYHYADASTANHRSYPRNLSHAGEMQGGTDLNNLGETGKALAKTYAIGGGPSASHNYSTGWMYAYFLTGEARYFEAAINAADYVIRIEDGSRTIFRWLCRGDTGLSIETAPGYWGPGRASANSLHALLTGYELTGDNKYLTAADQLIRRVIHPEDDINHLDLLNAELRWFYTMFLQALMRYIDIKAEYGQNDAMYAYARASLDHFSTWMLHHERPTLDEPEKLQYPTETWAAQDMRKWQILQYAAWLRPDSDPLKQTFQERADFFFEYVCSTLGSMPTRSLCRPVVLMLQFGWQRHWFMKRGKERSLPDPNYSGPMPPKTWFVPQRTRAIMRAKLLVAAGLFVGLIAAFGIIMLLLIRYFTA